MDPYERLTAINESMKKAIAMLRKNPAAMADAQQFGSTGHMRPDSPRRKARETEALRQMIRHGSSPLASERPDSIHGKINRRSGQEINKTRRRSPKIETNYRGSGLDDNSIGFPGKHGTQFPGDTARFARERGVRLPADKAEFKKKYGLQKESETKNETPETIRKNILKKIDKAANTKEDPKKVAARLKAHYDNEDSGGSPFGRSILDSFDPSKNPNEKIDQEFGAAKKALSDAGIKFKALQAIGSLDREKNTFNIPREDMRKARQVLKNFPNTQIKRA